jgi:hypothetical protein
MDVLPSIQTGAAFAQGLSCAKLTMRLASGRSPHSLAVHVDPRLAVSQLFIGLVLVVVTTSTTTAHDATTPASLLIQFVFYRDVGQILLREGAKCIFVFSNNKIEKAMDQPLTHCAALISALIRSFDD